MQKAIAIVITLEYDIRRTENPLHPGSITVTLNTSR